MPRATPGRGLRGGRREGSFFEAPAAFEVEQLFSPCDNATRRYTGRYVDLVGRAGGSETLLAILL
jgi:hypothetical protein